MTFYLRAELLGFYLELGRQAAEVEEEPESGPGTIAYSSEPLVAGAGEDFDVRTPIGFRTGYWGDEDKKR